MITMQDILEIKKNLECCVLGQAFLFHFLDKGIEGFLLQVSMFLPDCSKSENRQLIEQKSGKYYISPYSTKGEVVQKCLLACVQFIEHEVREGFLYSSVRIFGPHLSLEALMARANNTETRTHTFS